MQPQAPAGLRSWTAPHPNHGMLVSCYALPHDGVLLNPVRPPQVAVLDGVRVEAVVLTNRHHLRDAPSFGVPIHAPAAGLDDLRDVEPPVIGFADGDELPGGLTAFEVGSLSPDEYAVFSAEHRALAVADGVRREGDGPLGVFPDRLLGDDPDDVKRGLGRAFAALCEKLDFDHLLLAHGLPVWGDGRIQLRRFAQTLA